MTLGGASVVADNSGSIPTIDRVAIASALGNGAPIFGHIKRFVYWL